MNGRAAAFALKAPLFAGCLVAATTALGCDEATSTTPSAAPVSSSASPVSSAVGSASAAPATTAAPSAAALEPAGSGKGPFPTSSHPAMKDPTKANLTAPATFEGKFETTAGDFVVKCTRSWAPHAADRFYNLLKIGFYDDVAIYRVHPGFVVQFGIHGNPEISRMWQKAQIEPDKVTKKNEKGTLTFAQRGTPNQPGMTPITRATQVFINYKDNDHLDDAFAPVCEVTEGFELTKTFGGSAHHRHLKNAQGRIMEKGNTFLRKMYPELDYIKKAYVVEAEAPKPDASAKPSASAAKLEPAP